MCCFIFGFCFCFASYSFPLPLCTAHALSGLILSLALSLLSGYRYFSVCPTNPYKRNDASHSPEHTNTHTQAHWLWSLPGETGKEERSEEDSSGHTQTHRAGGWAKEWPDPLCNALLTFPCNRTHTHTHTHTGYTGVVAGQQQQHCSQTGPNPTPQQQAPEQQHHHQRALCKIRNKNTHQKKTPAAVRPPLILRRQASKTYFSANYTARFCENQCLLCGLQHLHELTSYGGHLTFSFLPFAPRSGGIFLFFFLLPSMQEGSVRFRNAHAPLLDSEEEL